MNINCWPWEMFFTSFVPKLILSYSFIWIAYSNRWLMRCPHCEAVNLAHIVFVAEGLVNNFLLFSSYEISIRDRSPLLRWECHVFYTCFLRAFLCSCEIFLCKGRTCGYCVCDAMSRRGWEIPQPDSNPEVYTFEFLSRVFCSDNCSFL